MTNSITIPIDRLDGSTYEVTAQAEHIDEKGYGIEKSTVFTLYLNPDVRIGYLMFSKGKKYWKFDGQLPEDELKQVAEFLQNFKEGDWEL